MPALRSSLTILSALLACARAQEPDQPPPAMPHASDVAHEHTNRLIDETSPYLLQHAHNPVDWYPWGPEALALAKELDKPIFLSVGYSACHWCHVMERESFENEQIAALMNEHFVNIKVDREERPDIDEIYMRFVQSLTGSGGWPMSVWLTPDLEPFHGGTYFPPDRRYGRDAFPDVLLALARAWEQNRDKIVEQAARNVSYMRQQTAQDASGELAQGVLERSLSMLAQSYDPEWGGFGGAPKFPHAMDLRLLFRHWKRTGSPQPLEMAVHTLDRMAAGGIHDQIGGGFARYSTDEKWLIPHFEKMLYDNALLIPAYLDAWLVTGEERHAQVARDSCDWVLREMVTPEGGFASTLDADSEGEEGRFYVWTPDELMEVLGAKHGAWAAAWFGVTEAGNFEHGASALWRPDPPEEVAAQLHVELEELEAAMAAAGPKLMEARSKRVRPGWDDKVLASWNGLMIAALAQAWQVLGDDRWLDAARRAADHVLTDMRQEDGRLFATARHGRAHLNAYLDDYAFVIAGLLDLYESDFDERWMREALELNEVLTERFEDKEGGGYFTTGSDHEQLIVRSKNPTDGALPSGAGVQALNLLRLAELTGNPEHAKRAERTIKSMAELVNRYPSGFSQLLAAVDVLETGAREIVIAGERGSESVEAMLAAVRGTYLPQRVVVLAHPGADAELLPLVEGRSAEPGAARAFVCRNYTCKLPVDTPGELAKQLADN